MPEKPKKPIRKKYEPSFAETAIATINPMNWGRGYCYLYLFSYFSTIY